MLLETLVNQKHLKDIEIILVNDGSKDRSVDIVKKKFMKEYPDKNSIFRKAKWRIGRRKKLCNSIC